MTPYRERDIRQMIRDVLEATREFDGVYLSGLPEAGRRSGDARAVWIEPGETTGPRPWDDTAGDLLMTCRVNLAFLARDDDPQIRDETAELLLNVAANALGGQALAGATLSARPGSAPGPGRSPGPRSGGSRPCSSTSTSSTAGRASTPRSEQARPRPAATAAPHDHQGHPRPDLSESPHGDQAASELDGGVSRLDADHPRLPGELLPGRLAGGLLGRRRPLSHGRRQPDEQAPRRGHQRRHGRADGPRAGQHRRPSAPPTRTPRVRPAATSST